MNTYNGDIEKIFFTPLGFDTNVESIEYEKLRSGVEMLDSICRVSSISLYVIDNTGRIINTNKIIINR